MEGRGGVVVVCVVECVCVHSWALWSYVVTPKLLLLLLLLLLLFVVCACVCGQWGHATALERRVVRHRTPR